MTREQIRKLKADYRKAVQLLRAVERQATLPGDDMVKRERREVARLEALIREV